MVLLAHLGDHDVKELSEVNTVALVLREFSDQFRQVILRRCLAEGIQSHFHLLLLDGARARSVEQVERLLNLFLLSVAHLLLVGVFGLLCLWVLWFTCHFNQFKLI